MALRKVGKETVGMRLELPKKVDQKLQKLKFKYKVVTKEEAIIKAIMEAKLK